MSEFDQGWYYYCNKEIKKRYNQAYYKKNRNKILKQKREYYKRNKNDNRRS